MSTYLGWLLPWGTPVTLLGESAQQVAEAQRELVRIGIDRPAAAATGDPRSWTGGRPPGSFPVADFAALTSARTERHVAALDVRRAEEWAQSHLEGALHVPLHDLPEGLHQVPGPPTEVWVYCETGYRSSIAAGLLAAAGRRVVLVDDRYSAAVDAGLTTQAVGVPR